MSMAVTWIAIYFLNKWSPPFQNLQIGEQSVCPELLYVMGMEEGPGLDAWRALHSNLAPPDSVALHFQHAAKIQLLEYRSNKMAHLLLVLVCRRLTGG